MHQIDAFTFVLLGKSVQSCFLCAKLPIDVYRKEVDLAITILDFLGHGKGQIKLDESSAAAWELRQALVCCTVNSLAYKGVL